MLIRLQGIVYRKYPRDPKPQEKLSELIAPGRGLVLVAITQQRQNDRSAGLSKGQARNHCGKGLDLSNLGVEGSWCILRIY